VKIFVDSAELKEIKLAYEWGIADGVTTNPSLMKKAVLSRQNAGQDIDIPAYITQILKTAEGTSVSLEVTEVSAEGMIRQGKRLYELFNPVAGNVTIKIPVNPAFRDEDTTHFDGFRAVRELAMAGIPINCTLIFTPEQAMLAAKAGARFVSPFAGRVDDFIRSRSGLPFDKSDYYPIDGVEKDGQVLNDDGIVSGIDMVSQCVQILRYFGFETDVLAASLRNSRQVREAALAGADVATLPFDVIKDLLKHHKTFEGMEKFTADVVPEYADIMK
jgi:transaldolase